MKSMFKLFKLVPLLALVVLSALFYHNKTKLEHASKQAQQLQKDKNALIDIIDHKNNELLELHDNAARNQASLQTQIETVKFLSAQQINQQQQIRKLKHDNEALKNFLNAELPFDIKRLYQRPDIATREDFKNWLPARASVPTTSEQH